MKASQQATDIHSRITESALDRGWRIETILHLGAMSVDESLPEALAEALRDDLEEIAKAVGISGRRAAVIDEEEFLQRIRTRTQFGFLVSASTPVRQYISKETWTGGWGCFRSKWFYAEDFADLAPAIEQWVTESCAQDVSDSFAETAPAGQ